MSLYALVCPTIHVNLLKAHLQSQPWPTPCSRPLKKYSILPATSSPQSPPPEQSVITVLQMSTSFSPSHFQDSSVCFRPLIPEQSICKWKWNDAEKIRPAALTWAMEASVEMKAPSARMMKEGPSILTGVQAEASTENHWAGLPFYEEAGCYGGPMMGQLTMYRAQMRRRNQSGETTLECSQPSNLLSW